MYSVILRRWWLALAIVSGALTGCGGGSGNGSILIPDRTGGSPDEFALHPYDASSEYADVLVDCVTADSVARSCTLEQLPILGMQTENPTVADIMARVVVTHDWMGQRFEQILTQLPDDIPLLLRATTAIVIDADIRPAYYTSLTGAIYLDPAYLWFESAELATISRNPDHRAGYSDPLRFRALSRYVLNDQYAFPYGLFDETSARTMESLVMLMGELLYHELAHANDFLPPATWDYLDPSQSVYRAIESNEDNFVSVQLNNADPLTSDALYSLADVMYWGDDPTDEDLAMTAEQVGEEFEVDGAADHYAYASMFEDTAMLFEEAMMKLHFGIDRDVAFTEVPADATNCNGYTVRWGVRNRLGDTDVKARAQLVLGELLPSQELSLFFQNFPLPQPMPFGANWCDTITMGSPYKAQKYEPDAAPGATKPLPPRDLRVRH